MLLNGQLKNFKRLYWQNDKKLINDILSTVNKKYLLGLVHRLTRNPYGSYDARIYCRYSGYQFQVSAKTITDELKRRGI